MRYVLSPDQMRALESDYFTQYHTPSIALMERAAKAVVDELSARLAPLEGKTAVFACGPGMNGGDGYAAARLFAQRGGRAIALALCPIAMLGGDAQTNAKIAQRTENVFFGDMDRLDGMPRPDAWVDALFGIGLSREIGEDILRVLSRIASDRRQGSLVLAVDIPSGIDGRSGAALGAAVQADVTVTFSYPKLGHFLGDGMDAAGELLVAPLGIPEALLPKNAARVVERADVIELFASRRRNTHKGTYGHLLLVAGSRGMAGAAMLSARAALKSGVGLVTVACAESIVPLLQQAAPTAMCLPLPEEEGAICASAVPILKGALPGKTALALGPGLSPRAHPGIVRCALESGLPAVLDADALNLIAADPSLREGLRAHHIITPHPGEAARLLARPMGDAAEDVRALRALGATALLKGATTLVYTDLLTLSASGSPGMAKGGSGDVLTGILGALLARGVAPERAAWMGSELHGLAGEDAAARLGETAMSAADLIDSLGHVYHQLEELAR